MGPDLNRICNIAGYPIYNWAAMQLNVRSKQGQQDIRDDSNLLYLANKGAWVRVLSSVNLERKLMNYYRTINPNIARPQDLAESYVLYGGTSTYAFESNKLNVPQYGINNLEIGDLGNVKGAGMNLRSGIGNSGAYNLLGDQEVKAYGYRPMPGITSVNIEATGRLGSLRQATVNFKVWDKYQLDIIDALYFRPGFTVLIEYGHAKYYDNDSILQTSEQWMIGDPFKTQSTKEQINILISNGIRRSYGNYGGMLGIVTHFDFSMNTDGGYDCSIRAMSLGAVMGNFPINHLDVFSKAYQGQLKVYLDNTRATKIADAEREYADKLSADIAQANLLLNQSPDMWAKLKIDDPFSTLLYNTKNILPFNENITTFTRDTTDPQGHALVLTENETPYRTTSTLDQNTIGLAIIQGGKLPDGKSVYDQITIDVPYYTNRVNTEVSNFTGSHDISLSSTSTNLKAYYLQDNGSPGIIYFSRLEDKITDKYIAPYGIEGQTETIYIKLNVSNINSIITNRTSTILKIQNGVKNQDLWKESYSNYFDVLFKEKTTGGYYIQYTYFGALNPENTVFSLQLNFPIGQESKAKEYFTNPNTKYKILEIDSNAPLPQYGTLNTFISLQVVDNDGKDQPGYTIDFGGGGKNSYGNSEIVDLSFIQSIEEKDNYQILATDGILQENNANLQKQMNDLAAAKKTAEDQIQSQYDADQVALTTESKSTLELMLKSLLLFAINHQKPDIPTYSIDLKKFIRDIFSEGCYAKYFKDYFAENKQYSKKTYKKEDLARYINTQMNEDDRLEMNLNYGNNFFVMSGENLVNNRGEINDGIVDKIPTVDFGELIKYIPLQFGENSNLGVKGADTKLSVYIPLGLFFLFLNHTAMLYNKQNINAIGNGNIVTPMTYIDFNPETNFFLSNESQISLDPFKFLIPFQGGNIAYDKLFGELLSDNRILKPSGSSQAPQPLFNFSEDKLSGAISVDFKTPLGDANTPNGYIGKLMKVMVDVNYLLTIIEQQRTNSDEGQAFFQTTIERILEDLNKSMGNYNAFRLSYNDSANCFVITDDQLQAAPDSTVKAAIDSMITSNGELGYEIPVYGKNSIARSFEMKTDMSGRIASMLAISANPVQSDQVATARNTSDFGIYNIGTYDRFISAVSDSVSGSKDDPNNFAEVEAAINFNNMVKDIYSLIKPPKDGEAGSSTYLNQNNVERALAYYKNRIAQKKNIDPGSATAMIIPLKTNIVMDGMSGLYPFQLYTINENMLPYRYSTANLVNKKPAFSIARMTHTIDNNQWTTSVEGFMTLLRPETDYNNKEKNPIKTIITNAVGQESYVPLDVKGFPHTELERITYYEPILKGIGAPITDTNLTFLYAWRTGEGGVATHNPFNTTYHSGLVDGIDYSAYHCCRRHNNSNPVKSYKDAATGVKAIVNTLLYTGKGKTYKDLVDLLIKGDASLQSLSAHPSLRPKTGWGTGLNAYNVLKARAAKHENLRAPVIETTFTNCKEKYADASFQSNCG